MLFKKLIAKKTFTNMAKFAAKREGRIIVGSLTTIAGHIAIQKILEKISKKNIE